MVQLRLSDSRIEFHEGRFDSWCVYIIKEGNKKQAPTDTEYFIFFQEFNNKYPNFNINNIFVEIYNQTGQNLDQTVIDYIYQVAISDILDIDLPTRKNLEGYLVVIYMAMIAEENKKNTKLGKRIKRLGMHNLLIDGMSVDESANASKGVPWRTLDQRMKNRGF